MGEFTDDVHGRYCALDLRFTPPVRGDDPLADWRDAVVDVTDEIGELL